MNITSKTGLLASPTKKAVKITQKSTGQLKPIIKPAPFILKSSAGLFNPYPYACSLLCNHPTDIEAKELLNKAKDSWAAEGKNVLLTEEVEAIKEGMKHLQYTKNMTLPTVEMVPEELFRRYTETDSRPLTPAPTLASAVTKATSSRKCITPDPIPTIQIKEKTLLILDLRRSHSQETLSCYSSSILDPPLIKIQQVYTRSASLNDEEQTELRNVQTLFPTGKPRGEKKNDNSKDVIANDIIPKKDVEEPEEEFIKRRGKRKRKKDRNFSQEPSTFRASLDPETQVGTIGDGESRNTSARPSLVPGQPNLNVSSQVQQPLQVSKSWDFDSFLDIDILKHLRRELNEDIVYYELNDKKQTALYEALKTVSKDKIICEELLELQKQLSIPPVDTELWINFPRTFTRSSARFELPMADHLLSSLTPLDYVRKHVYVSKNRKLLYNCIFSHFKNNPDLEIETERQISGKVLQDALDLMMGKPMSNQQKIYMSTTLNWNDNDSFDFKTFCGICALCERLLAPEYCTQLPSREQDPCYEIEEADFEILARKLHGQDVNEKLRDILYKIKTY